MQKWYETTAINPWAYNEDCSIWKWKRDRKVATIVLDWKYLIWEILRWIHQRSWSNEQAKHKCDRQNNWKPQIQNRQHRTLA